MYFDGARADKQYNSLGPEHIANAVANSPDGGVTLVLSKLDLYDIPAEASRQLATIGRNKAEDECILERLTLGNNRLTTLPTEFTSIVQLRYLNLKHNSFTRIPDVVTLLPGLDTLDISHNKITNFPVHPGQLLQLRVFSFTRNKITQLPTYFPQFRCLEVLRLDRNPIEWPPRNVLELDSEDETQQAMKAWIHNIQEWIEYQVSPHDDSGYGENIEINKSADKHQGWQFPRRREINVESNPHSRSISMESNASLASDSFARPNISAEIDWRPNGTPPSNGFDLQHDNYLSSPADSDTFDTRSSTSQAGNSDDAYDSDTQARLRMLSVTMLQQQSSDSMTCLKQGLPDLRSPQWQEGSQNGLPTFTNTRIHPSVSQDSTKSIDTQSDATPTGYTPSMAHERNSYFQRLSILPQSVKLPEPLLCLVDTARSILFVTSQIYQTIEHYAIHAIDEKHAAIFKKVLEPANTDMVQLIRALDRYDTSTRRGLPSGPTCRSLLESCRNTITVTHKAVDLFGNQLRIAPCDDVRYSRWILLELYASTAEVSVAWQNLLPHSEALKGFLTGKQGSFLSVSDPQPNSSIRGDSLYPAARPRNVDFAAGRTHNARRHAGSFSHRDVEIGKELPNNDEPPAMPALPVRTPIQALRITPKRQATAPPSMSSAGGSVTGLGAVPALSFSKSATEETTAGRLRTEDTAKPLQSISKQKSTSKPKLSDVGESRHRVDLDTLGGTLESVESASRVWDVIEASMAPTEPVLQEHFSRARDLSKKVSIGLRTALEGDSRIDNSVSNDILVLLKTAGTLSKSFNRSHPTSPGAWTHVTKLIESLDEIAKSLHPPPPTASSRPYSPAFANSFTSSSPLEDNRLGSSLSRTRSAQPAPTLKTGFPVANEGPRSAIPSTGFKIPSRNHWADVVDPG